MTFANGSSHIREGRPARKEIIEGLHGSNDAGDGLSRQVKPMIPVTKGRRTRTISPMGRGTTPAKFKNELADRLRSARIVAGYETQKEFAAALSIQEERYKKWESGRTPIPHTYVPLVCELLNIDANYLFGVRQLMARKAAG
jgi:DNA-binding XRE family transcriptional regulator